MNIQKLKKSLFLQSFKKLDKNFLHTIVFDVLFYLILALVVFLAFNVLLSALDVLNEMLPFLTKLQGSLTDLTSASALEQEIDAALASLRSVAIKIIGIVLIAIITICLTATYLKGLIWSKILKIKFGWLVYRKFLFLRLIWYLIWALLFASIVYLIKKEALLVYLIILGVLFLHFTMLMLCLFRKEKGIWKTIKQAFGLGIKRSCLLLVPYLLSFFLLGLAYSIFSFFLSAFETPLLILEMVAAIIFLAWLRVYISSAVKRIEDKKSFIL